MMAKLELAEAELKPRPFCGNPQIGVVRTRKMAFYE